MAQKLNNKMTDKIKTIENSRILVRRIVGKVIDKNTRQEFIQTQWRVLEESLELGSMKEPQNLDIVAIKFDIPSDADANNPFSSFFKKLG